MFKTLFVLILTLSICLFAGIYDRNFGRDFKLPSQKLLESMKHSPVKGRFIFKSLYGDVDLGYELCDCKKCRKGEHGFFVGVF